MPYCIELTIVDYIFLIRVIGILFFMSNLILMLTPMIPRMTFLKPAVHSP